VFNELQDKLFITVVKHNNILGFLYFNGDMFLYFRPSSGHTTTEFYVVFNILRLF